MNLRDEERGRDRAPGLLEKKPESCISVLRVPIRHTIEPHEYTLEMLKMLSFSIVCRPLGSWG